MKRFARTFGGAILAAAFTWGSAAAFLWFDVNRSIAAMALVLEVLAVAASGERILAVLTSVTASLAFSWYYIDTVGSFRITTPEGGTTFAMMVFTALAGSQLALRAQRRAQEAIARREEMEQLQQLGSSLLSADTVQQAAADAVGKVVGLFGAGGALLRLENGRQVFSAGSCDGAATVFRLQTEVNANVLELYGPQPSAEVSNAIVNLIKLVLDRARNAEERARIDDRRRGEELRTTVLNALAHNFKTPLTSIKAAASMLRGSSEIPSAQGRELVIVIDEEADRLDRLIRESLDLAQIESHRMNPRHELCSLLDIAERVSRRVSRYLAGRELTIDVPDDLPPIEGDNFLFEQMLMQVVDNAWKYSRPGSIIEISAAQQPRDLVLTVRNTGSTISPDERDRIFDRFYRGASNRSRVEGTGLGLAIAKAIAEAHGGTVWLDCEPAGPAFRFCLPLPDGESA